MFLRKGEQFSWGEMESISSEWKSKHLAAERDYFNMKMNFIKFDTATSALSLYSVEVPLWQKKKAFWEDMKPIHHESKWQIGKGEFPSWKFNVLTLFSITIRNILSWSHTSSPPTPVCVPRQFHNLDHKKKGGGGWKYPKNDCVHCR